MKKLVSSLMTVALLLGGVCSTNTVADAAGTSYSLSYANTAPTNTYNIGGTYVVISSGASKITVSSTTFSAHIQSAYMAAEGMNYATSSANINSTGKYYLIYSGTTTPKKNTRVTVDLELKKYEISKSVTAKGSLIG